MNRWYIAVILIAALLLVGAAGAVKPVREPVDRVVFVHYTDAAAKPSSGANSAAAFKLMGMKWNTDGPVTYNVYPANPATLNPAEVTMNVQAAFSAWDDHTERWLFRSSEPASPAGAGDGKNDVYFTSIKETNVIAVTTVWYYRFSKEIVEADIQLNTNMPWGFYEYGQTGATWPNADAYDVRNIATHEVGHVCGLADLYKTWHSPLTMYGYGEEGEVQKDTLEAGDIAGLQKLYGA